MEQLIKYISIALVLFSFTSLEAQTIKLSKAMYLGVSGGIVRNVLVGSEPDVQRKLYNNSMMPVKGPTFSVFVKNEIKPTFYLKFEAAYVRKGNKSANGIQDLNTEYFSVPLKIGLQPINYMNLSRKVQLGFELGPAFNIEYGHGTDSLSQSYSQAPKKKINKAALSVLAGANFEFRPFPHRILFFNTTFYRDLTPVLSYESGNAGYKAFNQGWMLTGGLMFLLH